MIRTDDQQISNINEHPDKTNEKSAKNVKQYSWTYLDPSIVYRALTSPVLKRKTRKTKSTMLNGQALINSFLFNQ